MMMLMGRDTKSDIHAFIASLAITTSKDQQQRSVLVNCKSRYFLATWKHSELFIKIIIINTHPLAVLSYWIFFFFFLSFNLRDFTVKLIKTYILLDFVNLKFNEFCGSNKYK